ncbi:MAG TPA: bifunctional nuclease domain-containing protein [Solirubrobacteraceae bacterium]
MPLRHDRTLETDAALVAAARGGDRAAFAALVVRHYDVLLATCRRAAGDAETAADSAQEAVVTALLGLNRLRRDASFGAWLVGIGLNLCRRALHERARWTCLEGHEPAAGGPGPHEAAEAARIAERVRAAIAALPPGQRAAVTLFYLGGLSHTEVAGHLDTRPGAVKTRLHKARATLRSALTDVHREELGMPTPVPMRIADVRRPSERPERRIVVLEEIDGSRRLPIWIGTPEADGLVAVLEEVELPRPGPYHFADALLRATGASVAEVRVSRLAEHIFYASVILADGSEIDARPSDALSLALVTGAPIAVAPAVLEATARCERERPELAAEATGAGDGASVLADEVRARVAENARELAALSEPGA